MIEVELEFRWTAQEHAEPCGVLLKGQACRNWFRILNPLLDDQATIRTLALKSSRDDSTALLLFDLESKAPDKWRELGSYGMVVGRQHPRLMLPTCCHSIPLLNEEQWDGLLGHELLHLWLPPGDWISFEYSDTRWIHELIDFDQIESNHFGRGQAGVFVVDRLQTIRIPEPPDWEQIKPELQQDIGTKENKSWSWTSLFRSQVDEKKREREIKKLLKMLKKDPDEGLKYALPMGGLFSNRGIGFGGNNLTPHGTDFSLSGLGGGGAIDPWQLDHQHQLELTQRYRELAQREMDLGRFRRAAYIYGELIGDLSLAASALEAGHHYREAAIIYRDKLNNKLEAANCLERGNLLSDAVVILEELKRYDSAAELYEKMDDPQNAIRCYEIHVKGLIAKKDIEKAADVIQHKLKDVERAKELLLAQWPNEIGAVSCIGRYFEINAQQGHHDANRNWLQAVTPTEIPIIHRVPFFGFLVKTSTTGRDQELREIAKTKSIAFASKWLDKADDNLRRQLLTTLPDVLPEDKLYQRHCKIVDKQLLERSRQQATSQDNQSSKKAKLSSSKILEPDWQASFDDSFTWNRFCYKDNEILAIAISGAQVHIERMRVGWGTYLDKVDEELIGQTLGDANNLIFEIFVSNPADNLQAELVVHSVGVSALNMLACIVGSRRQGREIKSITVPKLQNCLDSNVVGLGISPTNRIVAIRVTDDSYSVDFFDTRGDLKQSIPVVGEHAENPFAGAELPFPVAFHNDKVLFALGNRIVTVYDNGQVSSYTFEQPIQSLATTASGTRFRVAVAFEYGGAIIWDNVGFGEQVYFGDDERNMQVCFDRSGHLIAAGQTGMIFETAGQWCTHLANFETENPAAVFPGYQSNEFILVSEQGKAQSFLI